LRDDPLECQPGRHKQCLHCPSRSCRLCSVVSEAQEELAHHKAEPCDGEDIPAVYQRPIESQQYNDGRENKVEVTTNQPAAGAHGCALTLEDMSTS
jgi:hypothetical protein